MWVDDDFRNVFIALEECRAMIGIDMPAENKQIVLDDIEIALASLRKIVDAVIVLYSAKEGA